MGVPAVRARRRRQTFVLTPFLSIEVARPLMPSERDVWLTSRRRAYTRRPGRLRKTPMEHEPWPLTCAAVDVLQETPTAPLDEPVFT
ncbi:DUF2071 domain-containing protein [Streptomyces canus]|uniref:DUF2071 domain-containing protein n=1 Tax=Streptomyces canus TaxID=58343 RepID=UPI00382153B5